MYPKVVALDTDWTIFWGWLKAKDWGKGRNAYSPVENNIEQVDYWHIRDRTNHKNKCGMYADVPNIISDILKNGAKLAIVSRNTNKAMCDRALWYFKVKDAQGNLKSLIDLVDYDEVYDKSKTVHFKKIKEWAGCHYTDMILFDDGAVNNPVEMLLGVTFQVSRDKKGLTWQHYQDGINMWKRSKVIESPWQGINLNKYPKKKLLGYSGLDLESIELLEAGGRRHDRKEFARWGYGLYVADDPAIAKYYAELFNVTAPGSNKPLVCAIYARDGDIWDRMNKIWLPENEPKTQTKTGTDFEIAWSQEDRDRKVASWGVHKPYVLFARHPTKANRPGLKFPVPNGRRWNEMVVYPQVQEALVVVHRMSDFQLNQVVQNRQHLHYEQKLNDWNVTVPSATYRDFTAHRENIRK